MVCPKCKSRKFKKSEDINRPLMQYKTDKMPHGNYRYYICNSCGFRFLTFESYYREVKTAVQPDYVEPKSKVSYLQ